MFLNSEKMPQSVECYRTEQIHQRPTSTPTNNRITSQWKLDGSEGERCLLLKRPLRSYSSASSAQLPPITALNAGLWAPGARDCFGARARGFVAI